MRLLMFLVAMLFLSGIATTQARAQHGPCTRWEKRQGHTCVFNGRTTTEWIRQCFHIYDNTLACMNEDPNTLKGSCTAWLKAADITRCSSGNRWEQRWIRGCTDRLLREEFCSDSIDPNTIGHAAISVQEESDPLKNPNHDPRRNPNRR